MDEYSELFIGLDTSKSKISVAVAEKERNGEVRFFGNISAEPASVASTVAKLARRGAKLHFCYEAGPTGYELHRQIIKLGHECQVVAPSLIPKRPGDRVKTNRRDAVSLARLHRAGELTAVWVPDEAHEAVRDLVRARECAHATAQKARQQLRSFLLRHGRIYPGRTPWTRAHFRWLAAQSFSHPAHHIVLAEYIQAIEDADVREERLTRQVAEVAASWSMAPVVEAYLPRISRDRPTVYRVVFKFHLATPPLDKRWMTRLLQAGMTILRGLYAFMRLRGAALKSGKDDQRRACLDRRVMRGSGTSPPCDELASTTNFADRPAPTAGAVPANLPH